MITGGIKFFTRPVSIFSDGQIVATASTATGSISRALDRNRYTYWRSVGSNDTITETITITWSSAVTFSRIILVDHNFKEFNVKWKSGVSFVHFTSVSGLDGSQANVSETVFADDTAYYEVAQVTTTAIQIEVVKTQVANQEKYINQIIACSEYGTLEGYPDINSLEFNRNERAKKMLSGKTLSLKSEESMKVQLTFKDYPPSLGADIDLMGQLFDVESTFLVWLCGGRRGTSYFRKALRGFRLRDIFYMQTTGTFNPDYSKNVYVLPVNFRLNFIESVD
jgi:hypothetical protein